MSLRRVCLGLAFAVSAVFASIAGCYSTGCSSTPAGDCSSNPFQCSAGTTCTVNDCTCSTSSCTSTDCTPTFACLPSTTDLAGASCTSTLGKASCSDGLTCVVVGDQGTCTPYCNPANPCPMGDTCQPMTVMLGVSPPVIYVCELEGPDGSLQVDSGGIVPGDGGTCGLPVDGSSFDGQSPPPGEGGLPR
jgi:hypothetical protein